MGNSLAQKQYHIPSIISDTDLREFKKYVICPGYVIEHGHRVYKTAEQIAVANKLPFHACVAASTELRLKSLLSKHPKLQIIRPQHGKVHSSK